MRPGQLVLAMAFRNASSVLTTDEVRRRAR
jgi:hypothetical protein